MTTLALFSQLAGADLPSAVTSLGCSGCPDSQLEVSSKLGAEGLLWPRGELVSLTDAQCLRPTEAQPWPSELPLGRQRRLSSAPHA